MDWIAEVTSAEVYDLRRARTTRGVPRLSDRDAAAIARLLDQARTRPRSADTAESTPVDPSELEAKIACVDGDRSDQLLIAGVLNDGGEFRASIVGGTDDLVVLGIDVGDGFAYLEARAGERSGRRTYTSGGQEDDLPVSWFVSRDEASEVLFSFLRSGTRDGRRTWIDTY